MLVVEGVVEQVAVAVVEQVVVEEEEQAVVVVVKALVLVGVAVALELTPESVAALGQRAQEVERHTLVVVLEVAQVKATLGQRSLAMLELSSGAVPALLGLQVQ